MTWPRALRILGPRLPDSAVGRALLVLAVLLVLTGLTGVVAHYRAPGRSWVIGFSAFSPYLMLAAPVAVIVAAATRQWLIVAIAGILTVACAVTQAGLYVATTAPQDAAHVIVMTANLKIGGANAGDVVAAVRRHHVEVLMLEELTPEAQVRLIDAGLNDVLPHHDSMPDAGAVGTGLWSRYPLSTVDHPRGFSFALISAQLAIPDVSRKVSVVALHMSGPVPDSAMWQRDIARLPGLLQALPASAPVIVGGDFNATPDVRQFRSVLTGGYNDAARQAGAGMTRTYPADAFYPPLIAIDHVLTRGAVATAADTISIRGSDHRALLVTVAVPRTF